MQGLQILCAGLCACVYLKRDKVCTGVSVSYLLSACASLAGFGNLMQDVLWCFSQVKGTIDIGVTEGKLVFLLWLRFRVICLSCTALLILV